MKQLTLRGFDDDLRDHLERLAREEGISLNKAALRLLREGAGLGPRAERRNTVGDSLDHLIGSWTEEQEREFRRAVATFDHIDEEMWE